MAELTKMKIVAFSDPDYTEQVGEYNLLVNPENYNVKNEQQYSTSDTTIGSSAQTAKYKGSGQGLFELVFFFDGTGVITSDKVDDQIKTVKDLIYQYNGNIHEPNYLRVYWGTQSLFQGRLKSWNVNYTMLDLDGTPLRAEAKAVIMASVSARKKALEEKKNSSDLTHVRTVLAGDNLPLMCYRIYGDSSFYIKVAKHNNITNFRTIKPGQIITFPPVI